MPIFRTEAQARILGWLLLDTTREQPIATLTDIAGVTQPSVLREVNQLVAAGLLVERRAGNTRLVRANDESPYFEPLVSILTRSFGPVDIVPSELRAIDGINEAHIVGSWARRFHGQAGPPPADLDVVVVGHPDRRAVRRAASSLERRLQLPVQITVVGDHEWSAAESAFLRQVQSEGIVTVLPEGGS
jgi:hypothetical protein